MVLFLKRSLLAGAVVLFTGQAGAVGAPASASAPVAAHPNAARSELVSAQRLQLRWSLLRNEFAPAYPNGRALARLALTNGDSKALPAQGWSLYFSIVDGAVVGPLDGKLVVEQVGGQLFRIRPGAGFAGVAPGATLNIDYYHPSLVIKTSKVPSGPYLVFDQRPETGHAIADYSMAAITRPEQLDTGPNKHAPLTTAEALYAHNARSTDLPASSLAPIFPTPLKLERLAGSLRLDAMPRIDAPVLLRSEAALARTLLAPHTGKTSKSTLQLQLRTGKIDGQDSPEAYLLSIEPGAGIHITGATPAGVFRALQSLRDLLPVKASGAADLPALRVLDAPRFAYRGFMMDVARNFQSREAVYRLLDLMARYKLNKFHFHLTDDEGWRLAIKGLPELTNFGAVRGHTLSVAEHLQPAYGSGPDTRDPHGSGHYSRADYIAILRYAAARHIEVIPELEMPGHARAAVKAMEHRTRRLASQGNPDAKRFLLNDPADRSVYTSPQMYHDQVLNPGMDGTYHFIAHVVADLVAMHKEAGVTLRTIHMGGDELPAGAWEQSPASLARMQAEGLATSADLWDYFYGRVDAILKQHGLFASGWEEMGARKAQVDGKEKLAPNPRFAASGFNVYVWNNVHGAEDLAYRLANAGYGTVLSPVSNFYLDMAHNRNPEEPGVNWGGYIELEKIFDFIPLDYLKNSTDPALAQGKVALTDTGRANIRGLQGNLFTEAVREQSRIDYMIMPRLLAVAERAWAPDPAWAREADPAAAARLQALDWSGFVNQLGKRVLPRLDADANGKQDAVAYRIAPPGLKRDGARILANHQLPGFSLRYTSDGSEPSAASARVDGPITARGSIRVAAFAANGRRGASSQIDNP